MTIAASKRERERESCKENEEKVTAMEEPTETQKKKVCLSLKIFQLYNNTIILSLYFVKDFCDFILDFLRF